MREFVRHLTGDLTGDLTNGTWRAPRGSSDGLGSALVVDKPTLRKLSRGTVFAGRGWAGTTKAGLAKSMLGPDIQVPGQKRAPSAHVMAFELKQPHRIQSDEDFVRIVERVKVRRGGLTVLEKGRFAFTDGVHGYQVQAFLQMFPGLEAFQHHIFRCQGERVHHLVATLRAESFELEPEVVAMLRSYAPDGVDSERQSGS